MSSSERPLAPLGPPASSGSSTGMAGLGRAGLEPWADDAGHDLRTPGAYEFWTFDAVDPAGNGVVITLFNGLPFYTPYLAQVASWQRGLTHSPLTVPWPEVLPSHYPAAYMGVYQGSRRVAQFLNLYPPGSCEASPESPEVRIGPNRITLRSDGSFGIVARGYPFEIRGGKPAACKTQTLSATLNFSPSAAGCQHTRPFRPNGPGGASHHWVLAAPHGVMTGRVQHLDRADDVALVDMSIQAIACHDHHYGHGALHLGVKRLAWGHLADPQFTIAWQHTLAAAGAPGDASPGGAARSAAILLFEPPHQPLVIEAAAIHTEQTRLTRWLVSYPARAALHGSDAKGNSVELLVHHPNVIDASPFHARLAAEATLTVAGRRQYAGRGVTHLLQLHRLRWPVLSDLTLRSVLPIASDDPLWRL